MRVLTWQWGRRGGAPRFAANLAAGFAKLPGTVSMLSLSQQAEILWSADPPRCDLPVPTYANAAGLVRRAVLSPLTVRLLARDIARLRPDIAVCAQPALLDPLMQAALRRLGVPYGVVVHDAATHPGDRISFLLVDHLQRRLLRQAEAVVALSTHVADTLRAQGLSPLIGRHPPIAFGPPPPLPLTHGGCPRLLCFGRLLPYKGLDLLAAAMPLCRIRVELRIVGSGPETDELRALRALPGTRVENRWVPEEEIGSLLAWADAVVLPYREASQSGVAAATLAARRFVVATRVGGLAEQLSGYDGASLCDPTPEALAHAIDGIPRLPRAVHPSSGLGWADLARMLMEALQPYAAARPEAARPAASASSA